VGWGNFEACVVRVPGLESRLVMVVCWMDVCCGWRWRQKVVGRQVFGRVHT